MHVSFFVVPLTKENLTFMVMSGADFGWGGLSRIASVGGSVAKAKAAIVSMIRLI